MARLLLIDDDIAEISAVKRVLARAGLAPVLATNASDAQAALAQRPADLVLVGAACEQGEALALLRRLEAQGQARGLPVLVLGEAADLPAGAEQLPRPVDPELLGERVQALLARPAPAPAPAPPPPTPSSPPAPASPPLAEAAAGLDALFELAPPAGFEEVAAAPAVERPAPPSPPPAFTSASFEVAPPPPPAAPPAPRSPVGAPPDASLPPQASAPPLTPAVPAVLAPPASRRLIDEVEERARAEELLSAETEARRARAEEQRAALEVQAREEAARLAEAQALRARQAEERAHLEAEARADAARHAEEALARARTAEAAAREEAEARRQLEAELARLRSQLDADRAARPPAPERVRLDDLPPPDEVEIAARRRALALKASRQAAEAAAAVRARVRQKLEQVRRADYFTILGLGRGCTPQEVQEAADRLLADLAPERLAASLDEAWLAHLEEIRQVVEEAREVLGDAQLRVEYLGGLRG